MKKFKVKSYGFIGQSNVSAIDVVVEADIIKYEDNGLVVFKKKITDDSPIAIFDVGKVWIREQE